MLPQGKQVFGRGVADLETLESYPYSIKGSIQKMRRSWMKAWKTFPLVRRPFIIIKKNDFLMIDGLIP
jgi:hypothetical protein